jgi:hypothetical protein
MGTPGKIYQFFSVLEITIDSHNYYSVFIRKIHILNRTEFLLTRLTLSPLKEIL